MKGLPDGVLLWQVANEYLAASRKLVPFGYNHAQAFQDINNWRKVWTTILPTWAVMDKAELICNRRCQPRRRFGAEPPPASSVCMRQFSAEQLINFDHCPTILLGPRREVTEQGEDFIVQMRDQHYVLQKEELEYYQMRKSELRRNSETQLFFPGFYEHVVHFEGSGPRRGLRRGEDNYSLTSSDGLIRQFEARLSETSAMKLVLETYFEKAALHQWIGEYEAKHGAYFTNDVTLFGTSLRVHSKEGEIGRFVLYTGQEELATNLRQNLRHYR